MDFMLGCDPELFVKKISDNSFVSAHDMIPGTKLFPHSVKGGAIQVDGCALEFNVNPSSDFKKFEERIDSVLDELYDRVEGGMSDHYITFEPTATFDQEYFDSLPDEAKVLGCSPDYNAYTLEENIPPETTLPFRTAGGHIHLGWGEYMDVSDEAHFLTCANIVKQLDVLLFPASLTWDNDQKRRELYGKKGAFRPKSYGVEYRPLSCAWVETASTVKFVYETSMRALDLYFNRGIRVYEN